MSQPSFFLSDIRNPAYLDSLGPVERGAVDAYLHDMKHGPADGNMACEWQATCRGYYQHLEILESLPTKTERETYRKRLLADIEAWLAEKPDHHQVQVVREELFGNG